MDEGVIFLAILCGLVILALHFADPEKKIERYYHDNGHSIHYTLYKFSYIIIFLGFVVNIRFGISFLVTKLFF
jgi:hypothetical protein